MIQDVLAGFFLGNTADCWGRKECIQYLAQAVGIFQSEEEIGTKMVEVGSHCGERSFLAVFIRKF